MKLHQDVQNFVRICETLISNAMRSSRALTEDESMIVKFYCKEVLEKLVPEPVRNVE